MVYIGRIYPSWNEYDEYDENYVYLRELIEKNNMNKEYELKNKSESSNPKKTNLQLCKNKNSYSSNYINKKYYNKNTKNTK